MKPGDLAPGDVVQLSPTVVDDPAVRGCLMIVRDVKPWGVIGAIPVPAVHDSEIGEHVALLLYRATWEQIEIVGRVAWGEALG